MKKIILVTAILICGNFVFGANAQVFKMDNGQTVVIQEVKNNPIVTIDTWIKTGSIDEDDYNNGVAHFLEHLFFKGTKNHAPGEFDKILETKGAITNAATSKDFTHYYITLPSKDFDLAMELHADMMLNPMIPRNEMEKERKVVLEEIGKDLNSPSKILEDSLTAMMYTNHPYKRKVIGKSEIIETITREQVLNFYNTHYAPSNMVTIVIGDVDTQHALDKIKETFYTENKKINNPVYKKESALTKQKKDVNYIENTESGYIIIGFRGVPINHKDVYSLDVLATILGEGRSSILNQVLKEKKRIAFSVSAGNGTYRDDGIFAIRANFEPEKCKQIQDTIFEEITKIQEQGITDEQLKLAKNIIERDTYYARESVSNISSEIGYTTTLTGDIKFYDNYISNIKSVTKNDVKKAAEKYLGKDKSAVAIVLPKNAEEIPIKNKKNNDNTSKLISQNSQTQKYELSKGETLLYTPNSANDIIAISIHAKGGQLIEKIPSTGILTASTMLKGTKHYTPIELFQVMEDNGIKISPAISADTFKISILTTKDGYEKTLELLDEVVNNATFDEIEIGKAKSEKLNKIKQNKDRAIQLAIENYRELIYLGTPYTISSNIQEKYLPQITREDIVNYYNKIFEPQNIVISINGNVDKEKTIEKLNEIFNKRNPSKTLNYNEYSSKITPITTKREKIQNMPTTQTAWIILGWQVPGINNKKEIATLEVIDSLIGNGMSSRLFKNLREQQGLAYQLGTGYSPNVLRGSFLMYIGTNPETLEKAKQGLFDEIKKLKTEYVNDKELQEAKDKLIGNYIIGLETNLDKASTLGWYETSGLGYEYKQEYEKLINSVTDSDIIEIANKYFNDDYAISIVTK